MFGWLRKNKSKQVPVKMSQEMMRVLSTYLALLKAHPHRVMDASWLPAEKQKLIEIFKISWLAADRMGNDEMRKETEDYWCSLSFFQPGVGALLIDFENTGAMTLERALRLSKIADAERKRYEREIRRFSKRRRL
jgi:hypothetical protein